MGQVKLANNAYTTLATGCTAIATTVSVTSSAAFPAVTTASTNWFYACFQDVSGNLEIVKVTDVTGTTWTITRAVGGTTAQAFASGSVVELRVTAETISDILTVPGQTITGGSIDNTPIGATTPSSGVFSTLTVNGYTLVTVGTVTTPSISDDINLNAANAVGINSDSGGRLNFYNNGTFAGFFQADANAYSVTMSSSTGTKVVTRGTGLGAGLDNTIGFYNANVEHVRLSATGNLVLGGSLADDGVNILQANGPVTISGNLTGPAGTTSMTSGFLYISSASGAPTGVPSSLAGHVALYYDTATNNFYAYNGAWKKVTLT
jgi:hypothetical protein